MAVKTVPVENLRNPHYCLESHDNLLDQLATRIQPENVVQATVNHESCGTSLIASGKGKPAEEMYFVTEERYGHELNIAALPLEKR